MAEILCFDCRLPILDEIVWLGEIYPDGELEWPFHRTCADQPWPLYEVRRELLATEGR